MSATRARKTPLGRIRNIGIIAHIDAGKTTLTERLLYVTGRTHKIGEVHDGAATMDYLPQEQERGITITSAVTSFDWLDHEIHLIDTPGHVDFTIEVARSLRVLDGAVVVLDGVSGVEPQTETVWHQANRHGVPRIAFVNKLDRPGADFDKAVEGMRRRFSQVIAPIQIPIGLEREHQGVVDVVTGEAHYFSGEDPREVRTELTAPPALAERAIELRAELVEALADLDDELAGDYLEGLDIDDKRIRATLRARTLAGDIVPVLAGSALRNRGVLPVLDAIVRYLPAPTERPPIRGEDPEDGQVVEVTSDPKGPLVGLIYKVQHGNDGRRLCYTRLYSGAIKPGEAVRIPGRGISEKIARVFLMHASKREQRLDRAGAGQIVALLGPRKATTGDTICVEGSEVLLERLDAYKPVINLAVEPELRRERDTLLAALARRSDEDPTFAWREDEETGELIISGMGELHLEVVLTDIRTNRDIGIRAGRPMVLAREALRETVEGSGSFDAATEDASIRTEVRVRLAPREREAGSTFALADDVHISPSQRLLLEETIIDTLESGPIHGDPVVDVAATLLACQRTGSLDAAGALPIAAANAVRDALTGAATLRLEPLMSVEIHTPGEHVGEVIGALNARRGHVDELEEDGDRTMVRAHAPLAQLFGFATVLRNASQGRATFDLHFLRYDAM